jgi:transcriptional regulator with XRE-family HTH domain
VVKTRHSLSCLENPFGPEEQLILKLRLVLFFVGSGKSGETLQEGFAHRTGYHRNYIGQLERGEKSPSLSALFNLAEAFDKRRSELLTLVERYISRGS